MTWDKLWNIILIGLLLLGFTVSGGPQTGRNFPALALLNTGSAVNANVGLTYTAIAGTRIAIGYISAICSAGTATLTLEVPTGTIASQFDVGTTLLQIAPELTTDLGQSFSAVLTACGAGNTGRVNAHGGRY